MHPKRENKPAKRGSALIRCSLASTYEKVRVAGNILGASGASSDEFSNGGKLGLGMSGSPEESASFFVRFIGVSGATSLALRLRGALGGLAGGIAAEDAVEIKAREAPLVLGGMVRNKWVVRKG